MHSSRMRTVRCSSHLRVCLRGGVCLGGVFQGDVCQGLSATGGVCPGGCLPGGCLSRGCLPGVSARGGGCLPGGCLPHTHTSVNRITDACENTRMHSRRMHTTHLLTVSQHALPVGDVPAQGGVPALGVLPARRSTSSGSPPL